jgi:hypothetical protein
MFSTDVLAAYRLQNFKNLMVQTKIKAKVYSENERKYNQLTFLLVIQLMSKFQGQNAEVQFVPKTLTQVHSNRKKLINFMF